MLGNLPNTSQDGSVRNILLAATYFENFSKSKNIFVLNNYITAVVVVGFTTGIWLHLGVIFKASLSDNFNSSS